jgi:hypothetical protein
MFTTRFCRLFAEQVWGKTLALNWQTMRLQVVELCWQARQVEEAPQQLTAICHQSRRFLAKSRSVVAQAKPANEEFLTRIVSTREIIAESRKRLQFLDSYYFVVGCSLLVVSTCSLRGHGGDYRCPSSGGATCS